MTVLLSIFYLTAVLGFFNLAAFGTFGVLPIEGAFCVAMVYVIYHAVWKGLPLRTPDRTYLLLILTVWAAFSLSSGWVILSSERELVIQSLKTWAHFSFIVGAAVLMLLLPFEARHWRQALRFHFLVSFCIMLFGLYQLPARLFGLPLGWIEFSNVNFMRGMEEADEMVQLALMYGSFYRATSLFSEPSGLAAYGGTSLIFLVVPLFRGSTGVLKTKWFLWTSIAFTMLAVFLTFSLTGVMIIAASAVVLMLMYRARAVKAIAVAFGITLAVVSVADFAVYTITDTSVLSLFAQRIGSIASGKAASNEVGAVEGESITQRLDDYEASWEIWKESPVVGVGPGNFANSVYGRYHSSQFPATTYGSALAEGGLIGFFVVSGFLLMLYARSQKGERQWVFDDRPKDADLDALAAILPFKGLVLIFVGLTGNFLVTGVFWFDVVFVVSIYTIVSTTLRGEQPVEFLIVSGSWQGRLRRALAHKETNDSYHRREGNSA